MYKQPLGVADNKSYKDMYHFDDVFSNGDKRENLPSLNVDPAINTSIKKNPYRSNVEIEKDEVILKPDLSALFKAKGPTHKQGGIDVLLEPDSFVFSNDPLLAFTEDDHKLFEFKEGGSFKAKKNTPADVLKRNIDVKHYNTLTSNIQDIKKDDLAKKSSVMMLEKYINSLGNIAFLQEQKKGFPTGTPSFSVGTAPVYNPEIKGDIQEQKQYVKYGGPIMQGGGKTYTKEEYYGQGNKEGVTQRFGDKVFKFHNGKWVDISDTSANNQDIYNINGPSYNANEYYGQGNKEGVTQRMGDKVWKFHNGMWMDVTNPNTSNIPDTNLSGVTPLSGITPITKTPSPGFGPHGFTGKVNVKILPPDIFTESNISESLKVPDVTDTTQGKNIDWQFNPWQRLSQTYNLGKLATLKRYMPMRSQFNPSYADPNLVNPEQAIGDLRAGTNQATNALGTLNPILRNAQASAYFGDYLNKVPGVRTAYDNQNAGIRNQFNQYNNQVANTARGQNMQNDQKYYEQSVIGQQNFDNMRGFLGDQYMNNLMTDVQDNQSLAYNLATLDQPAYGYNFRTGNFYRNPKDIRDAKGSGADAELAGVMRVIDSIQDPTKKAAALTKLYGLKVFGPAISQQKKGGRVGNPYK